MIQRTITTILLFLLISLSTLAQNITGTITDIETNEVLPFTNILFSEKGTGTVSNVEGVYVINTSKMSPTDSITFSYGGYSPYIISVNDINKKNVYDVKLQPLVINLDEVVITSKNISVKDIIKKIEENFEDNYEKDNVKEEIFIHSYSNTTMNKDNPMELKKSSFDQINRKTSQAIIDKLPNNFVNYVDSKHTLFYHDDDIKLKCKQAISLEESSLAKINEELEDTFNFLAEDIEGSFNNDDIYYKFRSGIIGAKLNDEEEEDTVEVKKPIMDSLYYNIQTKYVKMGVKEIYKNVTDIDSDYLEFVTKTGKYNYELEGATMINEDVAYKIAFTPKSGGLFQGSMYVSSETFAILQMEFQYAPNKRGKHIQLLGIGYSENFKKMKVIFENDNDNYFVKYIYQKEDISFSVERNLLLLKKQKRFMFDKTLEEIKIKMNLHMTSNDIKELLVLNRTPISETEFDKIKEEDYVKVKKEVTNTINHWDDGTVIAPTSALKEYQRKGDL